MELDLHRHGQLNVMAIIAPTVSEKTGLWVCGCALVRFLRSCISKCTRAQLWSVMRKERTLGTANHLMS